MKGFKRLRSAEGKKTMEYENMLRHMAIDQGKEQKLVRRLAQGRREALEQVVRQYTAYVSAVSWRTAGGSLSREDGEEIAADVFLSLWNSRKSLDPAQGLRPWLAAAARNRTVDYLRRQKGPPPALLEDNLPQRETAEPEQQVCQKERSRLLWEAVERLGEPDASLVFRYYYQQEKLKDVAEELGLNLSTAKSRLRRGKLRLKEILLQGGEWE